jgi:putative ABC transport system permease protein
VPAPLEVFGDVRPALLVLLLAVGAVLLIACANVANLLLARSEGRQKELALRVALGAGRHRIVRQLLTESMLLALVGGVAGVALAYGLTQALVALDPLKIPRVQDIALDGRVLAFTAAVSLVTGLLFGIAPGAPVRAHDLQSVLKEGGRDSHVATGWLRRVLVIGEVAASVVLVAAALLLARSFARLLDVNAGFNPATSSRSARRCRARPTPMRPRMVKPTPKSGAGCANRPACWRQAPSPACRWPPRAATGASGSKGGRPILATTSPPTGRWSRPATSRRSGTRCAAAARSPTPTRADTLLVIVVNETMAKKYWPGVTPSAADEDGPQASWITVVGVVADIHHRGLDMQPRPEMYRPHTQFRYGARGAPRSPP